MAKSLTGREGAKRSEGTKDRANLPSIPKLGFSKLKSSLLTSHFRHLKCTHGSLTIFTTGKW